AQGLANDIVLKIIQDKDGNFWFGTAGGGVSRFDGIRFTNFNTTNGLVNDNVLSITEDAAGNIWLGTRGGVSCYRGKSFTNFVKTNDKQINLVFGILKDKNGNIWFGSGEGEVSCYTGKEFINYATGFNHSAIYDFYEDSLGIIWMGTDKGLRSFDGRNFADYRFSKGMPGIVYKITGVDNRHLWIGTNSDGAFLFKGKSFINYNTTHGLVNNLVKTITIDRNGNTWFGTAGGLSKYDGKSFTNYTTKQGLPHNFILNISEDSQGNLWIGTEGGGLSRYDGQTFTSFTTSDGLPDNVITSVVIDSAGIFIGTNYGFAVLDSFYSTEGGIKAARILPQNKLTNEELRKYALQIKIYNTSTGFPVKDVNYGQHAMISAGKGLFWVGTGSDKTGLVRFDNSVLPKKQAQPSVVLQKIKISNENICWNDLLPLPAKKSNVFPPNISEEVLVMGKMMTHEERETMQKNFSHLRFDSIGSFYPIPYNLVLPYMHNNITFEFAAIETVRPFLVKYQYWLEGYDKHWNPETSEASANYGNIKEGKYTFRLRAMSPDGVWSESILYHFRVLPPWYRTLWAYSIYVLLFGAGIWAFVWFRSRNLRRENLELDGKVKQRTQELQQSIESLKAAQSQLIQSEKMASLGELTAGIAHEIQNPLNFVNNFSEVSTELVNEMEDALEKDDKKEAILIASDIKDNLQKINHHGKRAGDIVKGMLQHSRASTGKKEPTDINALADEYLRLSYHGLRAKDKDFNASFKTSFDESIGKVEVVPQDIGRVLLNLYNNAFYA
ncbi:MAG: hypothetical protein H0U39_10775, partial [Segetibacter sp.]|nr:hypothetical protein [Segetibacter sp.]